MAKVGSLKGSFCPTGGFNESGRIDGPTWADGPEPLMKLRHLEYFVAAAEELNFTHAADRLHVSQPPFSKQIQDLEGELGVHLFQRERKGVALTAAGKAFLIDAREILRACDQAATGVPAGRLNTRLHKPASSVARLAAQFLAGCRRGIAHQRRQRSCPVARSVYCCRRVLDSSPTLPAE